MGNLTAKTSGELTSFMTPAKTNIKSLKVHFSPKQLGTGDPSPENVREIEGWDGVNVYNDPKYGGFVVWNQLYDGSGSTGTNGGITYTKLDNGTWEIKGTSDTTSGTAARRKQIKSPSWEANHVYWFSARAVGEGTQYLQMVLSNSGSIKTTTTLYDGAFAKPTEKINQFSFRVLTQNVTVDVIARPQIIDLTKLFGEEMANYIYNLERTKTGAGKDYFFNLFPKDWYEYNAGELTTVSAVNNEPYTNLSIDWSSDIGTAYGGYVDLISGELVEEYGYVKLEDLNWTVKSNDRIITDDLSSSILSPSYSVTVNIIGEQVQPAKYSMNLTNYPNAIACSSNGQLIKYYDGENPQGLMAYQLATPISHQLTPTQLKSFVGQNNFWSNADYVEIEYDLIETIDIQKAKRKIMLNQPQLKTVSDKVVSFNTDMVAPMKNCKIYFKPIQLGTGDASITNFRDIKGWTGLDSYVNGDKISVDWSSDDGTIYGGYLDLAKGEVVATYALFDAYQNRSLFTQGNGNIYIANNQFATYGFVKPININESISTHFKAADITTESYPSFSVSNMGHFALRGIPNVTDTVEHFTVYVEEQMNNNTPVQFVMPLVTPIIYQLTPQQLLTLKSTNHIWSETNGQQIDVTYWTRKNLTPTPLTNYLENQAWTDSAYISSSGKKTTNTVSASHFLTNQILLEAGTYVLSGFSYYAGSDSTRYRIHAYDSTGKWVKQITFQEIDNLSPVDISFTLDTDTYVNLSIAMDFDGVLAKIN